MEKMFDQKDFSIKKKFMLALLVVALVGVTVTWGLKTATYGGDSAPLEVETTYGPIELTTRLGTATMTEEGVTVEASHFPLKLTMMLNKTTFEVGEPVNITFIIENIGNETLALSLTDGADRESFVVYDEAGSQVYKDIHYYPQVYIPLILPPSLSTSLTPTWYQNLSPGSYRIVGLFISGSLSFTVETEPITITIGS